MLDKNQENFNVFKPSVKQQSFLEAYLSQEVRLTIEQLSQEAGIDCSTYYLWVKKADFNKWFYEQIDVNKYRFAPRIMDNILTKAMNESASVQDKELALRVLGLYTPTEKRINENADINYAEIMQVIKDKANDLGRLHITPDGISEKIE